MIQDIFPHKLFNQYDPSAVPDENSVVFHFDDGKVLSTGDSAAPFPKYPQFTLPDRLIYLFSIDDTKYFLLADSVLIMPEGCSYKSIAEIRHAEGALGENIMALFTARHLDEWYRDNRLCGRCGTATVLHSKERALKCPCCENVIYPRLNPAVIVGVTDGDRLLVTRYASNRGVGHNALVAGFTEVGETFEETVQREVMEEVGLRVKNIRYYKSQPWGYSGGILAGFFCDVDGATDVALDETELQSALWTKREDIVGQPDALSLTNEMMTVFRLGEV